MGTRSVGDDDSRMYIAFISAGSFRSHVDFENGNLSGTESQIYGVATELIRRGHKVHFVRRGSSFTEKTLDNGMIVTDIETSAFPDSGIDHVFSKLMFSYRAREYIEERKPDVINTIMKYSAFFTSISDIPAVHFAFTNPSSLNPWKDFIARNSTKLVESHLLNHLDAIVVRNDQTYDWARKNAAGITKKIPTAIDPDDYQNVTDGGFIVYGGRFSPEKNVGDLVKAYADVPGNLREEYELKLVGEGPMESKLRELTKSLGISTNVKFHPWLPNEEFRDLLGRSTCAVLPSSYEGMPVFLIEAMGCEKPVIGSDIPGIADLVNHGETGLLFDTGDETDLRQALERLLKDQSERRRLGTAGRKTVERSHGFSKVTDSYLELFEEVQGG